MGVYVDTKMECVWFVKVCELLCVALDLAGNFGGSHWILL